MRRAMLALLLSSFALSAQEMPLPKPTPHHEAMKNLEGTWDAVVTMQMAPGQPPMVSKASEVNKLLTGGLWLQSEFTSEMMGTPFEGRGLFGYDPATHKHVGTWVDSMTMAPSNTVGTCKDGCKEMTCTFDGLDMKGKKVTYKEISVVQDPDHRTMTMYTKAKGGKYAQTMTIAYTRRK
jgi:hypothetical protein